MNYYVISRGFGDNAYAVKDFGNDLKSAKKDAKETEKNYMLEYTGNEYAQKCFFCKIVAEI